jgi:hypothetical protein
MTGLSTRKERARRTLRRLASALLLIPILALSSTAQTTHIKWDGFCEQGGVVVNAAGVSSTTKVQASRPACTVTVYDSGTTDLASICSDRLGPTCTPKANPFTADSTTGYAFFYAAAGRYTIVFTSGTSPNVYPSPFTRSDLCLGCETGGAFNLTVKEIDNTPTVSNVSTIRVTNGTLTDDGGGQVTITIAGGGGCTPTGSSGQVLYNNAGACAGIVNAATADGTTLRVTSGDFITDLRDTNHLPWIAVSPAALAVNYLTVANAATGNPPTLSAAGTDSNIHLDFDAKGTGGLRWRSKAFSIPESLTDAATIATDASLSNRFRVTLEGNRTLGNPTNASDGQQIVWEIIQDAVGGRTLAFDTKFVFGAEITGCTIGATATYRSFVSAVYNSTADRFFVVACVTDYP